MGAGRHVRERRLFAAVLLGAGLAAASLAPPPADAMIGGCVSDPFVVLSNGAIVHLYAYLPRTHLGEVRTVTYTVAGPVDTSVIEEVNTDGLMGTKERLRYSATNRPGDYDTTTEVATARPGDPVVAVTAVGLASSYRRGQAYQILSIHLSVNSREEDASQVPGA